YFLAIPAALTGLPVHPTGCSPDSRLSRPSCPAPAWHGLLLRRSYGNVDDAETRPAVVSTIRPETSPLLRICCVGRREANFPKFAQQPHRVRDRFVPSPLQGLLPCRHPLCDPGRSNLSRTPGPCGHPARGARNGLL